MIPIKPIYKIIFAWLVLLLGTGFFPMRITAAAGRLPVDNPVPAAAVVIPLGGNTWKTGPPAAGGTVSNKGIAGWTSREAAFTTYVRFAKKGKVKVWLHLKTPAGAASAIRITALNQGKTIQVQGMELKDWYAGEWAVTAPGYVAFTLTGVSEKGGGFADIASFKLSGGAVDEGLAFVKNNEGNFFHWGRRGPSVHLSYPLPENKDIEWFYNEVTVPAGNDVLGSYFMANGFAEGYFGMQVNSDSERRILFSVWSPFQTDDPGKIPDDQKIRLLKKGQGVYTGEFGNEGSGGQSYFRYNWQAGTTYRFLLQGKPGGANSTVYTAYFYAPEAGRWMLIASFARPQTHTYLKRFHSFLENFKPEYGNVERKVLFTNQWVRDAQGNWTALHKALFTGDNTAAKKYRMDHAGGVKGNAFYLRNCGFFNDFTPLKTTFERPGPSTAPQIELQHLPE
jgi:hypothetical protein